MRTSQLTISADDGIVKMPIYYKAAAMGLMAKRYIGVKLSNLVSMTIKIGGECGDR